MDLASAYYVSMEPQSRSYDLFQVIHQGSTGSGRVPERDCGLHLDDPYRSISDPKLQCLI